MKTLVIASEKNIEDIVSLRVQMQIEDWNRTVNRDYSCYAENFAEITRKHIQKRLNDSLFFALLYLDGEAVAMCAIEELSELPQMIVCANPNGRHCCLVSVYTKPAHRGHGYQQECMQYLLNFAKEKRFTDISLTTNTPDAAHIYKKVGFKWISDKYFLEL